MPVHAFAQATLNLVTDTRVIGDENRTRFVADLTTDVDVRVFPLADPYRIVIDLPEVHFQLPAGMGETGRGLITAWRFGLISRGQSRIVLDATGPVRVDDYFVIPAVPGAGEPARLVVDLVTTTPAEFETAALEYQQSRAPTAPVALPVDDGRTVIVIDPGHGGIDTGAIGLQNLVEKQVVLAFSQELAAQLRATGRYDVILTRTDDTFLSLDNRVAFARTRGADVFLSIHADSFPSSSTVRGTAVYTVSERASNEIAAQLAAGENRADILAGVNIAAGDDLVADILVDLARRETNRFSVALARDLVDEMEAATVMSRSPHQEAGFVVLKAPDVPSVLVELGFLTNPDDARNLGSETWRRTTAAAMVGAIEAFFATRVAGALRP
ncbi:MAG: N-acetylmuramoyl-L-alanine amidase [Bauldia sp.]|nr:N-acetylmuramoyl-L-alanine amidase [Bauldia sp.]